MLFNKQLNEMNYKSEMCCQIWNKLLNKQRKISSTCLQSGYGHILRGKKGILWLNIIVKQITLIIASFLTHKKLFEYQALLVSWLFWKSQSPWLHWIWFSKGTIEIILSEIIDFISAKYVICRYFLFHEKFPHWAISLMLFSLYFNHKT